MIPAMIIPVLNRYDLLTESINAIDYEVKELLIINNGKDEYRYYGNKNINKIRILNLPSNLGVGGSWNLGIKLYPHEPFWTFSSADTIIPSGGLEKLYNSSGPEYFVEGCGYNFFTVGEDFVRKVGMFDEYIYPAYFEDNDYNDRIELAGVAHQKKYLGIHLDPSKGSQTIHSDNKLMNRNHYTFEQNKDYYYRKRTSGDYTCLGWNLDRRRQNEWMIG
jgi:GT2 family glycosyltransferase